MQIYMYIRRNMQTLSITHDPVEYKISYENNVVTFNALDKEEFDEYDLIVDKSIITASKDGMITIELIPPQLFGMFIRYDEKRLDGHIDIIFQNKKNNNKQLEITIMWHSGFDNSQTEINLLLDMNKNISDYEKLSQKLNKKNMTIILLNLKVLKLEKKLGDFMVEFDKRFDELKETFFSTVKLL